MKSFIKIWKILNNSHKIKSILLLFFVIFNVLLELIGIGIIIPIISLLVQDDFLQRYSLAQNIFVFIGEPNKMELLLYAISFIFVIFFLKFLYSVFFVWWQQYFSTDIMIQVSKRLYTKFLTQPYYLFLNRNSSEMLNILQREVSNFHSTILQSIALAAEMMVILSIIIMLIVVEPIATMFAMLTVGIGALLFNLLTRNYFLSWGKLRIFHSESVMKHTVQGLNGIKDIKILNQEKEFIDNFASHNDEYLKINRWNNTLQALPRLWLEIVAVLSFVVLIFVFTLENRSIESILPTLALIGVSTFRILPSMNRVLNSYQAILFQKPSVNVIYDELDNEYNISQLKRIELNTIDQEVEIEISLKDISYNYPESLKPSLKNISFSVGSGESVGIIGKSGSGKSTLTDIILGLLTPQNGKIFVYDKVSNKQIKNFKRMIGYVPQSIYLTDDTLMNNIAFGIPAAEIDEKVILEVIDTCQLTEFIKSLPKGLNTFVGDRGVRLSGGQRHRIGIARALYRNPNILVLDEATSSVDSITEKEIMSSIDHLKEKRTLIIISHRLSTVYSCNKIIELHEGEIKNIVKGDNIQKFILERNNI